MRAACPSHLTNLYLITLMGKQFTCKIQQFLFSKVSRPTWGPTRGGGLLVKTNALEFTHPAPSSSQVRNEWSCTATVPMRHHDEDKRAAPVLHLRNYSVILSVLDPRKCEYLKDCSLDFEHAYMTTYLAS